MGVGRNGSAQVACRPLEPRKSRIAILRSPSYFSGMKTLPLLALFLPLLGCQQASLPAPEVATPSPSHQETAQPVPTAQSAAAVQPPPTETPEATLDQLAGSWGYSTDCFMGRYVTLDLSRTGSSLIGDWSEGSRVNGLDGKMKVQLVQGKQAVSACVSQESQSKGSGYPTCPEMRRVDSRLVKDEQKLRWYKPGAPDGYVRMERSVKSAPVMTDNTPCGGKP